MSFTTTCMAALAVVLLALGAGEVVAWLGREFDDDEGHNVPPPIDWDDFIKSRDHPRHDPARGDDEE